MSLLVLTHLALSSCRCLTLGYFCCCCCFAEKSDAFSFGVCFWEMLFRQSPYPKFHDLEAALKVHSVVINSSPSSACIVVFGVIDRLRTSRRSARRSLRASRSRWRSS